MTRKMKDSGVEWIGEIPEEWSIVKVKSLFELGRGRVIAQTELKDDGLYPVYSSQTKNNGCLGYIDTYDFDKKQLTWTTDGANAGTVFLREGKYNCTNVCGTLLPRTNDNLSFLKYDLEYIAIYHKRLDTNGYKIMNNEMAEIRIVRPELCEQNKIADYLDSKCNKIDQTIERESQVIEKLKEYKQSVITEAVTRGLNSDAPMKDSGVEWIGEIPITCNVIKFGRIARVMSNLVDVNKYKEYKQVSPENIEKNTGRLLECKTVEESGVISENHLFYKGQILYSKVRPKLNKATIAPFDGLCSADMYPIETVLDYKYLLYYMISNSFLIQVTIDDNRVKMPKINKEELAKVLIVVPREEEQKEIAGYLDKKCSAIDKLISNKEKVIEKLTEYKKSLIYECVTGKREVQ